MVKVAGEGVGKEEKERKKEKKEGAKKKWRTFLRPRFCHDFWTSPFFHSFHDKNNELEEV